MFCSNCGAKVEPAQENEKTPRSERKPAGDAPQEAITQGSSEQESGNEADTAHTDAIPEQNDGEAAVAQGEADGTRMQTLPAEFADFQETEAPTTVIQTPAPPAMVAAGVGGTEAAAPAATVERHKSHGFKIAAFVIAAALLIGAGGFGGYQYYSSHSRPQALARYDDSLNKLTEARKGLSAAIKSADRSAGKVSKSQVTDASTISSYHQSMSAATGMQTTKPRLIKNTNVADAQELNEAAASNTESASRCTDAAAGLTKAAQAVTDSKSTADKALSEVEKAVAAAERQKTENDKLSGPPQLNLEAIARGDYSSMEGTWTNPAGAWMTISDGKLSPQTPVDGTNPPYQLHECQPGQDDCIMRSMPSTQHQLAQDGAIANHHGSYPDTHYLLLVVQKGAKLYNTAYYEPLVSDDPTEQSRDRIIATTDWSQGAGAACPDANCAYYRSGDDHKLSKADENKLKQKISTAQTAVDGLDDSWAKDAKAGFQCRLDVAGGANKTCTVSGSEQASDADGDPSDTAEPEASHPPTSSGVADTQAIRNGDFSSIAGHWCNAENDYHRQRRLLYARTQPSVRQTDVLLQQQLGG
ncbi:DUF6287 domain-containing protein [Bifidobacterium actinocoloniiforme]|uniref:DUF6287 domain-containing protein n=1 Tax=Bifidobacterium actinocoloniiforme TaxID=638619 RepID=UPI00118731DF|nr:DUF6287 domain-containing protein [Bifidobacterium actinocoloniiforme]